MDTKEKMIVIFIAAIVMISVFSVFAVMPTSAWGPYTGPKEPALPSSHHTDIADPIGDTYGTGAVQHDITSFSAYYTATELIISVTFAGTISPGDSGQPDAVVGYIDFDTDQDPTTGMTSNVDGNSPYTTGLGVDYFVDLFDYSSATGDTSVYDDTLTEVGRAPVSFTSNSFTVRVPLALLGGDDGIMNTATVLGTLPEATDACPNGDYIASSPLAPAPTLTPIGLIALLGLLSVVAALHLRKRRKS